MNTHLATLEELDGACRLRFARVFPVPPAQLWQAITEPDRLAAWFPQRVEYLSWDGEPRAGASIRVSMPGDRGDAFDGEVLACDPATVLELRWGTDLLRFELDAEDGETLLMLTDTFAEKGKAARDAAGWHVCLDALERALLGPAAGPDVEPNVEPNVEPDVEPAGDLTAAWSRLFPRYVAALGADAATIGPPDLSAGDQLSAG